MSPLRSMCPVHPVRGPGRTGAARRALAVALTITVTTMLSACHDRTPPSSAQQAGGTSSSAMPETRLAQLPLGDRATGPEPAGTPVKNPYAGSAQAVEAGKRLFVKMNCAGCHAYTGKGWMGPDLSDKYWRYGGSDDEIYKTLYEGRPQGMPAWGKTLPPDQIWQLVAYVQSLSAASPPPKPDAQGTGVVPATGTGIGVDALPPGAGASGNNPPPASGH